MRVYSVPNLGAGHLGSGTHLICEWALIGAHGLFSHTGYDQAGPAETSNSHTVLWTARYMYIMSFVFRTNEWMSVPIVMFSSRRRISRMLSLVVVSLGFLAASVNGLPRLVDKRQTTQLRDSYDFIVVGGGTSGLTVADRLSEAFPHSRFQSQHIQHRV